MASSSKELVRAIAEGKWGGAVVATALREEAKQLVRKGK